MSIGSTIKRLRRERDMTQEELAECLGLTSRAVSQWERDKTAPDISQIPALCHIFDVSADILLGIDLDKANEEISDFLARAESQTFAGNFDEAVVILREAIRKFPKSYAIMERLADALVNVYSRRGITEYDEVIGLCHRILEECTDSELRYKATQTLGISYSYAGKTEEMKSLAKEMPRAHFSYENFMLYRWKGDSDFAERQSYMAYLINQMLPMLGCLSGHLHDDNTLIYSSEDRIRLKKLQVDLLELLYPDGDYQYAAQYAEITCSHLVSIYLDMQDHENAWYWLEKGADFAIHFDTYDFDAAHTSPILRGYSDGGWIMEKSGNRSQVMLDWLMNAKDAEILRSDTRFDALSERLKRSAKK